jgi:hypothetical protein
VYFPDEILDYDPKDFANRPSDGNDEDQFISSFEKYMKANKVPEHGDAIDKWKIHRRANQSMRLHQAQNGSPCCQDDLQSYRSFCFRPKTDCCLL